MPAYNYYGQPYGYQPNGYQPMYTPVQQQPVQQQATPVTSGIIWISGEQEASMYPIAPNSSGAQLCRADRIDSGHERYSGAACSVLL